MAEEKKNDNESLPSFDVLWSDPITSMEPDDIGAELGGNLKELHNYCCIRTSHALITARHPITINSDYKDKNGNKYIIKVQTMKNYLTNKYGKATKITQHTAKNMKGIICFDVSIWVNATGHIDLWNGEKCAKKAYWD
eukprot:812561_1